MYFQRDILKSLDIWSHAEHRKPLILRGARQVGKTSAVKLFAKAFDQFIYLNLDRPEDELLFRKAQSFSHLLETVFFVKEASMNAGRTLIFIDEIQNSPEAIRLLRYFLEDRPDLYVIAAGSVMESLVNHQLSFPVGRVEYLAMHPCSFSEFLCAMGETRLQAFLGALEIPDYVHDKLSDLFIRYSIIGGMPEVVGQYAITLDMNGLRPLYEGLITSFLDDVEKYSRNNTFIQVIRYVIQNAFMRAGERITFEGFGNSNFRSREMGEAFRTLEKTMILQLVYPTASASIPIEIRHRAPKLQMLDTGLVNFQAGIQGEILKSMNIDSNFKGKVAEHLVGQELIASGHSVLDRLHYWTRERRTSQAEVDFVIQYEDLVIPVEVKSGSSGILRSLHQFMDDAPHQWGLRLYSGPLRIEKTKTQNGKSFFLINLPLYMAGQLQKVLQVTV